MTATKGPQGKKIRRDDPEALRLREAVLRNMVPLIVERGLDWDGARRQNDAGWIVMRGDEPHQVHLTQDVLLTVFTAALAMAAEQTRPRQVAGAKGNDLAAASRKSPESYLARPGTALADETPAPGRQAGSLPGEELRHFPHHIEDVRAGDIRTRPGYQRLLSERWAAELARDFNSLLLRPIMVSRRADGSLWCIDGQHRLRCVCFYLGREDSTLEADVYEGLTYEQETILCESFVHAKPQGVLDYLRLKFERSDVDAVQLVQAVRAAGLDVAFDKAGRGRIASAGALVSIYEAAGQAHLSEVLTLLTDCFGDHPKVYVQPHLLGVHGFLVRYADDKAYTRAALVTKMEQAGLAGVQQKAAVLLPTTSSGNRATSFGKAMQTLYNSGRRANFLPEWQEGVLTQRQRERREEVAKVLQKRYGFTPGGRQNGRRKSTIPLEEDHS